MLIVFVRINVFALNMSRLQRLILYVCKSFLGLRHVNMPDPRLQIMSAFQAFLFVVAVFEGLRSNKNPLLFVVEMVVLFSREVNDSLRGLKGRHDL
jgi:hypothetical protein